MDLANDNLQDADGKASDPHGPDDLDDRHHRLLKHKQGQEQLRSTFVGTQQYVAYQKRKAAVARQMNRFLNI